jgi:hypothetical protein
VGSEVQILPGPPLLPAIYPWFGGVAQLGEHLLCKQGVVGSSPITSTSFGDGDDRRYIAEKRQQSALVVSLENCGAGGVSMRGTGLCQGESGSGASLDASIACLTGCLGHPAMEWCSERELLCAEQE